MGKIKLYKKYNIKIESSIKSKYLKRYTQIAGSSLEVEFFSDGLQNGLVTVNILFQ